MGAVGADHNIGRNFLSFTIAFECDNGFAVFQHKAREFGVPVHICDAENAFDHIPSRIKVKKIVWQSQFRISHRQVETYQKGSVFLAGDAAHIHSPLGGHDMNLGIEDAAWLAWLIEQDDMDRYTQLRHPVAKRVLEQVDQATRFISSDSAITTFLRRYVLPLIARRFTNQRMGAIGANDNVRRELFVFAFRAKQR